MKGKKVFLIIYSILFTEVAFAQNTFQMIISPSDSFYWYPEKVLSQSDSSLVLLLNGYSGGINKACIFKMDASGNYIWQKKFEGDSLLRPTDLIKIPTGYLMTAYRDVGWSDYPTVLIKTDLNGDTLWTKTYFQSGDASHIEQAPDGDLTIIGQGGIINPLGKHFVMRTDSSGNIIYYNKYYGPVQIGGSLGGFNTFDGGTILSNEISLFIKLDSSGNVVWNSHAYKHANKWLIASRAIETKDSSYIALMADSIGNDWNTLLIKVNNIGDTIWTKEIGSSFGEIPMSIIELSDGGLAICGNASDSLTVSTRPFLLRLDSAGNVLWSKIYSLNSYSWQYALKLCATYDNGFAIAGATSDSIQNTKYTFVIKTDSSGNSGCPSSNGNMINKPTPAFWDTVLTTTTVSNVISITNSPVFIQNNNLTYSTNCSPLSVFENINDEKTLSVYPNPFKTELFLKGTKSNGMIYIYDLSGKQFHQQPSSEMQTLIHTEKITSGFYLLNYTEENKSTNFKMTKF